MRARACPKCKSINVNIKMDASSAFGAPQKWKCNDCGFESFAIFPEEEINEKQK